MSLEQVIADALAAHVLDAHDGIRDVIVCGCGWEMADHVWLDHQAQSIADALRAAGYDRGEFFPVRFGEHGRPLSDETYYVRFPEGTSA